MKDILLDENNDLLITNGDLTIGDADKQNQKLILTTHKGEWKEKPEVGAAVQEMLSDDNFSQYIIEAKKQLEYDGMQVDDIRLEGDQLIIDGKYKQNG
jgi:hypothetical protein